jgi:hypothetical protein
MLDAAVVFANATGGAVAGVPLPIRLRTVVRLGSAQSSVYMLTARPESPLNFTWRKRRPFRAHPSASTGSSGCSGEASRNRDRVVKRRHRERSRALDANWGAGVRNHRQLREALRGTLRAQVVARALDSGALLNIYSRVRRRSGVARVAGTTCSVSNLTRYIEIGEGAADTRRDKPARLRALLTAPERGDTTVVRAVKSCLFGGEERAASSSYRLRWRTADPVSAVLAARLPAPSSEHACTGAP